MKLYLVKKITIILISLFCMSALFLPNKAFAARQLTLTPNKTTVEVGKNLEVKVEIDTDGEKVGLLVFDTEFSTEILEGFTPSSSGSVFSTACSTQTATKYECGIGGMNGFSGKGLVATLIFKGRQPGQASVSLKNIVARFGPTGAEVAGFSSNSIDITVVEAGATPPPDDTASGTTGPTQKITPKEASPQTPVPAGQTIQPKEPTPNSTSSRSESKVSGKKGSTSEDPLKSGGKGRSNKEVIVKGFSFKNPIYYGILPTILLLALVCNLAIKLYFTEKRRHIELVRIFDSHLGALSSLESKLDLVDQKGEDGKEKFLQEFETAKSQLMSEENTKLLHAKS